MPKHFSSLWILSCILLAASPASTQTVNKGAGAVSNITPVLNNVVQVASAFGDTAAECESDSKCIHGASYVYTGGPLGNNEGVFAFSFGREFLKGELKTRPPSRSKIFTVYKDWILDTETCKKLGFRSVTIKAKQYNWDRSKNPYGTINFEVRTVK